MQVPKMSITNVAFICRVLPALFLATGCSCSTKSPQKVVPSKEIVLSGTIVSDGEYKTLPAIETRAGTRYPIFGAKYGQFHVGDKVVLRGELAYPPSITEMTKFGDQDQPPQAFGANEYRVLSFYLRRIEQQNSRVQ
jgi:hypothetical protein